VEDRFHQKRSAFTRSKAANVQAVLRVHAMENLLVRPRLVEVCDLEDLIGAVLSEIHEERLSLKTETLLWIYSKEGQRSLRLVF